MRTIIFSFLLLSYLCAAAQDWENNNSFTYDALISDYSELAANNEQASLIEIGESDIGKPIHLLIISKDGETDIAKIKRGNKRVVFINNGIHAGEACGIDASFEVAKEVLESKTELSKTLEKTVILIIPVYNVGGMLNRGKYSRANQNGPNEHGFRGNAKNLDLNRDFIKCDSKNASVFSQVFTAWDPDVFVDTHTTNGSDHQYTLTVIASQKDKQSPVISGFQHNFMVPTIFQKMKDKSMEITPYIYPINKDPKKGIKDFLETPRFSSGYASLFCTFSFITEAHVYKPFSERVRQTAEFLKQVIQFTATYSEEIRRKRQEAIAFEKKRIVFPINWKLDTNESIKINFNGFKTVKRISEVTNQEMTFYDKSQPYQESIEYFNTYKAIVEIEKPKYYLIPQAYTDIVERLKWNKIKLRKLNSDTIISVNSYYITDYETSSKPYEAHYLHNNVEITEEAQELKFYSGDYLVDCNQKNIRFIVETIEPQGVDSYFSWNFFDGSLQQKEWFSDYAFEPKAKEVLANNPTLKKKFEQKRASDSSFAKNNFAQLYFIYKRSKYYETSAFRYPIFRIE